MTSRVVVLDTNLALLLIIGAYGPDVIGQHKKLEKKFDAIGFAISSELIAENRGILFCPHVLAETSNLLRLIGEPLKTGLTIAMGEVIKRTEEAEARSAPVVANADFARLGLTDAVLLQLTVPDRMLLTTDLDLYLTAVNAGKSVVNFTHLQAQRPDFGWR